MKLSIVMTVVDGGATLERCLDAVAAFDDPPPLEVLIPFDDSVAEVDHLSSRYPDFRFLPMGSVSTERPSSSFGGQHELFDRRRAAGLAEATGDLVAILEDRGVPRADWARTAVDLHERLPHAVIGGAVENGVDQLLNWAVYFCDFSRYQAPLEPGPREWVTDVNVVYKRSAIEATRPQWQGRYHETTVHWELMRRGETLYLTPELVVEQRRQNLDLPALLEERREWGRLFAYTRARELDLAKRLVYLGASPLLPSVLLFRHGRTQWAKKRHFRHYVKAAPAVALLLGSWCLGEAEGYLTKKA